MCIFSSQKTSQNFYMMDRLKMKVNLDIVTVYRNTLFPVIMQWHSHCSAIIRDILPCLRGFSLGIRTAQDFHIRFDLQLQMVCRCERGWLFVSLCQPCDETVTCPMCDPWSYYTNWTLGCGITKAFVAMPNVCLLAFRLSLLRLDLPPLFRV